MNKIKLIYQCDTSWGSLKLGESNETLCKSGCVTTNLSSLSAWFGKYINPRKLVKVLKYTPTGLLYWKSIDESGLPFKFVYRFYKFDDKKLKEILYSKDDAALIQVNNGKHWVLVVGYSRLNGYKVFDPLKGDVVFLSKRYGNVIQGMTQVTGK